MFGSIYSRHPEVLLESLQAMADDYSGAALGTGDGVGATLQREYVRLLGVPEIGFRVRALYFRRALRQLGLTPNRVLDAGSGIGAYAMWLAMRYPASDVTGWELDERKVRFAQAFAGELGVDNARFERRDLCDADVPEGAFDLVINVDVLEHIEDYSAALTNMYRVLSPGGHVFIHTPQPEQGRIFKRFDHWHHEDHVREGFTPTELVAELHRIGFVVKDVAQTFRLPGRFAWELNHMWLARNRVLAGATFPLLLAGAMFDPLVPGGHALASAILATKL